MAHQPSQSDRAPNEGLTARAKAALTHPATLIALATLLVNDLVFKWLWPGYWLTGKLSDLAWVVFAPPLLALPLAFLARRNRTAQRAAWATAYIGLPLLYAAYNTFQPIHEFISTGLSMLNGTPNGSPFDPTDSIVIPLGVVSAVWVWRTANVESKSNNLRIGILVAAIACFASAASDGPGTGIKRIGSDRNGNLVANATYNFRAVTDDDGSVVRNATSGINSHKYTSYDGGLTWHKTDRSSGWVDDWGGTSTATPRGTFTLDGHNVIRTIEGKSEIVYSFDVGYQRALEVGSRDLDARRQIRTSPYAIHYDERSENVIVTIGIQGVVVGKPNGSWKAVKVGEFAPIDTSLLGRIALLGDIELWLASFAISLASLAAAATCALWSTHRYSFKNYVVMVGATLLFLTIAIFTTLAIVAFFDLSADYTFPSRAILIATAALGVPFVVFGFAMIGSTDQPAKLGGRLLTLSGISIINALAAFWCTSSNLDEVAETLKLFVKPFSVISMIASLFALWSVGWTHDQLRVLALFGILTLGIVVIVLFAWISAAIGIFNAKIFVTAVTTIIVVLLTIRLRRNLV